MSNVKKCTTVPLSCWRSVLFSCFWIILSVLRSLSSWCTNIKALRIYCQTVGTKVYIIETWIAAAVSGFGDGKMSPAIILSGSFKDFPRDLFII